MIGVDSLPLRLTGVGEKNRKTMLNSNEKACIRLATGAWRST